MTRRLTAAQARRTAIAAQGLEGPRPARADMRHLRRAMAQIGALQIDSVNVVTRAHRLTLFARLGAYPADLAQRAYDRRELIEYWAHVASVIPMGMWPLFRWRMDEIQPWRSLARISEEQPGYVDAVLDEVRKHGPISAGDLEHAGPPRAGTWWDWRPGKTALEWLFFKGVLAISHRAGGFTRYYDLAERVVPEECRRAPAPTRAEAIRELMVIAARSAGVGTASDLADWFRLPIRDSRAAVADLCATGRLVEAEVTGWDEPAYLHPDTVVPRSVDGRALLCPFDPLIWNRDRLERLFGFRYRIEIYTPARQRVYGYYVLPVLAGDRLAGRVDLKADRAAGVLRVRAAHAEPDVDRSLVAAAVADEAVALAAWLGLGDVAVEPAGDLAGHLATAVG